MDRKRNKISLNGWQFVAIPSALILLFSFYPMVQSLLLSFQSGKGSVYHYVGIDNYIRLLSDPIFKQAVFNTVLYLVVQVPIMLLIGLVIAQLLNNPKLRFKGFYRTAIFLPCVTSLVSYAVLFKSIFAVDGILNKMLVSIHLIAEPVAWLMDPTWARVVIIAAITWRWTGYNMIFYLSAMQNIDPSIYEAASMDGASKFRQFFGITIPMLKPIILFTAIISTNGTLQLFDEVVNITKGGPGNATMTISQYIYNLSFVYTPNFGYAATVSYAIVIMVAVLALFQLKIGGEKR
ncbi:lactose/L-arabinose transport system permease protein [Paenibacillus shirakamiensis]|uniref:Lactose/L-arabinose transport system permease protein n=1 Tax=Paenibacillus shirakamiensis TaxID=1265935 RepID=A0ABS4JGD6_9BACL|nr:sugar ABC transporter permease [Paenibacillus shirakamiensis]MBP2000110.1 lactose/L-arabinose transport system permease protein [Paenibacillus shirakamiensis]